MARSAVSTTLCLFAPFPIAAICSAGWQSRSREQQFAQQLFWGLSEHLTQLPLARSAHCSLRPLPTPVSSVVVAQHLMRSGACNGGVDDSSAPFVSHCPCPHVCLMVGANHRISPPQGMVTPHIHLS